MYTAEDIEDAKTGEFLPLFQEFSHISTIIVFMSNFKSLRPSKSMPQMRNHDIRRNVITFDDSGGYTRTHAYKRHLDQKTAFAIHQRISIRVRHIMTMAKTYEQRS